VTAASPAGVKLSPSRCVLEEAPILGVQAVQPRRDQGPERVRDRQLSELARGQVAAFHGLQAPLAREHAHGLDDVQRDTVSARDDRLGCGVRQPGDEAREQLPHRDVGQRVETEHGEVPLVRPPLTAPVEELRAGEGHEEQRSVPRPLEHVVDEVEQAAVGPLQVLEHEHRRPLPRHVLEEHPPRREERIASAGRRRIEPEEGEQRRLDPAPVVLVGDVLGDRLGDSLPGRLLRVRLGEPRALADHLAERPEGDALAVRG
jgi:hypothetical protein